MFNKSNQVPRITTWHDDLDRSYVYQIRIPEENICNYSKLKIKFVYFKWLIGVAFKSLFIK